MVNKEIIIEHIEPTELLGVNNRYLKSVQQFFPKVKIISRGNQLFISGELREIEQVENKLEALTKHIKEYGNLNQSQLENILGKEDSTVTIYDEQAANLQGETGDVIVYGNGGKVIRAKTPNQKKMVEAMKHNDILFAIGPAGTGKTYTAVALAVKALKNKEIKRIILARPAVEAGENLGFLPGDLKEKIDPYLRPLYDALDDMIQPEKLKQHLENRVIEIAPMAFMRGRTLDNAYVILDEAQNATDLQLKMFLTRMGPHAKFIVTGDLSQIDLPKKQQSGLVRATKILEGIKGIEFAYLTYEDVVRHKLVKDIIKAYDKDIE
ncbi:phosphate starvation protein PhoH [Bacteroidetes bacterium UKL13-3]|nr:phosphate starvation protein PhoH [Bacteroidetes bacterium UKL13-3]HCP93702.1 phosphate starvation-inducible protein PhoH [Bacteroidota bacterium]